MFRARLRLSQRPLQPSNTRRCKSSIPIVRLDKATLYRQYPSPADTENSNPPVLSKVSFSLPVEEEYWAVVSPASLARTSFLQALDGKFICLPPTARSYPYLLSEKIKDPRLRTPEQAIRYVGFDSERGGLGGTAVQGAYLSARYEAHREVTDWSLLDYLKGDTELNALEKPKDFLDRPLLKSVVKNFDLFNLLQMPVSNLSNGQTRRARIAKALLSKPELLLLDGPFMGLDPITSKNISSLLHDLAKANNPRLLLSLRPEDPVPEWISHLVYLDKSLKVLAKGEKAKVVESVINNKSHPEDSQHMAKSRDVSKVATRPSRKKLHQSLLTRDGFPPMDPPILPGEAVVEMQGVKVSYGSQESGSRKTVLGEWKQDVAGEEKEGLWWNLHRGERWGIFGPNGSGKTTLLSLITSDHPQTYGLPIKIFGRSRLPEPGQPGISIFELQSRMGHSSPEVHTYFPKHLTVRRVLESAWADTPLTKPRLTHQADKMVDAFLRWFAPELSPTGTPHLQELYTNPNRNTLLASGEMKRRVERSIVDTRDLDWAETLTFRDLNFSAQRVLLFLRAIITSPDLVILDEAFSGMDETVRNKCLCFLSRGQTAILGRNTPVRGWHFSSSLYQDTDSVVFSGLEDRQTLLVISHSKEDVPGCVRHFITLPEPGEGRPPHFGELEGPLEWSRKGWETIWTSGKKVQKKVNKAEENDDWLL